MLLVNNNIMRLFEVGVSRPLPTPEGEVEAENKVNIVRDGEGDFYAQVRADLDAPYRDSNTSYFDQSRTLLDLAESEDAVTLRYLPGRSEGFEKSFNRSNAQMFEYVPFMNDLFGIENQRVFGQKIFQQVQEEVEEHVSQEDFMAWITDVEPEMYQMLLDNYQQLAESEQFFHRDVVDEKQLEKKAFVEYIAREVLHQQMENYEQTGPNDLSAEEVFAELPGYRVLADKIPHIGDETHFETEFKDPFGQSLLNYVEERENREEARDLQDFSSTGNSGPVRQTESDGGQNLLKESGLASVERVLTLKPEEITAFLGGEV